MKKILLSIVLLCSMGIINTWAQNILLNPSFEEAVSDANWKWRVNTNNSTATYEIVTDAKEGQKALHVNVSNLTYNDNGFAAVRWNIKLQQTLSFEEGKTYELGFWVKGTAQTTALEFEILFGQRSDGTKVFLEGYERLDITADWTYLTSSFTVPVEADFDPVASEISLLFIKNGSFYLDNVSIKQVSIEDGSFEAKTWTNTIRTDRGAAASIEYITDDVSHGSTAMKATVTTAGTYVYDITSKNNIHIEDNMDFRITFDAKASANEASLKCYLPQIFSSTSRAPEFFMTTGWTKHSLVMNYNNIKPNKTRELNFYFHQEGITYWLDNVTVAKITAADNSAPAINAGSNITCEPGDVITLNAQVSDPDGDLYELWWSLPDTEEALSVNTADRKTTSLTFTAPATISENTDLVFTLIGDDNLLQGANSVTVTVKPVSTGINDIKSESQKYFFPNPAKDKLQLSPEVTVVDLYNINGTHLKQQFLTSHTMDITEYPAGIYLLKLTLKSGTVITNKLLKR